MSLEFEKKYLVGNFDSTFDKLKNQFGDYKYCEKKGFWWCNNVNGFENMLEISNTKILKKDIDYIKEIGELIIPSQDFQFVRLRIVDNDNYYITFKNKLLVNNIEQNTEYEFIIEPDIFKRIIFYLHETAFIFYFNIKKTWEFKDNNTKIELSKFNDLKNTYIEIETTGNIETLLNKNMKEIIEKIKDYNLKEEPKNYVELSRAENQEMLKRMKLSQYSREGYKILQELL